MAPLLSILLLFVRMASAVVGAAALTSQTSSPPTTSLSCVCTRSECEDVHAWECPAGGGVVWDACRCCRVCARVEDEPCGGPEGFHGACAPGLRCVLQPGLLRRTSADASGTCKRVPGTELSPDGCSAGQESVFGCDIVGRVCRCSHLPPCGPPAASADWPEGRRRRRRWATMGGWRKRARGQRGGGSGRGQQQQRTKEQHPESGSPLFTFASLDECEMNLAEVLRQEEAAATGGTRGVSPPHNCTGAGGEECGTSCPEGPGPCVCRPSLCPSASLPFTCPFGARVLRRATRIPPDCCDIYECAPPPAPTRSVNSDNVSESTSGAPKGPTDAWGPSGTQCGPSEVSCDIVEGHICRCTRLPACGRPQRRRRRGRRKKAVGPFSSLDRCKEALAQMVSTMDDQGREEEEEGDDDDQD
ncbi:cysteine-rich motor neuron 1 protein-like [Ischnura elegans]|uniref:cysteine-rich motor neuron 1 protein-like n=1 Tax=Ischnura elegans TaxID=197161 RepID=UPI001ED8B159|nr:cysteine-rich motor neuron 1 protein-like [Ischnura elegans]